MTKRTAGGYDEHLICEHPWLLRIEDDDPCGPHFEIVDGYDTPHTIAMGESHLTYDYAIANLRLMVASPELLDALTAIIKHHDDFTGDTPKLDYSQLIDNARAAISKATGA